MGARENRLGYTGELYVAAQLAHRGWDAALLSRGTQRNDILASKQRTPAIRVQCKTTSGLSAQASEEMELPCDPVDREWVVFVSLDEHRPDERPAFHIVPRQIVATFVYLGMRHGKPSTYKPAASAWHPIKPRDFPLFLERWDFLERDPASLPWLLDLSGAFWRWAKERPVLPTGLALPTEPAPDQWVQPPQGS